MRWSLKVGSIFGIRVEVHVTFLIMIAGFSLWGTSGPRDALFTALELLLLFACVLLHELGDRKSVV